MQLLMIAAQENAQAGWSIKKINAHFVHAVRYKYMHHLTGGPTPDLWLTTLLPKAPTPHTDLTHSTALPSWLPLCPCGPSPLPRS